MLRSARFLRASAISPQVFFEALQRRQFSAFFGVPDSLLKDLCAYITDNVDPTRHVITANEGNAVAMAAGFHLATSQVPVVYMQNSGFGNTLNPLLSLTHREVYKIPALMLIGWRGDPDGKPDEPQHVAQGRLMKECLAAAEVPSFVLDRNAPIEATLDAAVHHFSTAGTPFALLIKRDTFDTYKLKQAASSKTGDLTLTREHAINVILSALGPNDVVVSTTGMPSREVFEIRASQKAGHHRDFLTVGAMGHCSSIAAGIALARPDRRVFCLDGDGGALMHLGALAVHGGLHARSPSSLNNLKHIILNNGAHDSVGGQPTVGHEISLSKVAEACGYKVLPVCRSEDELKRGASQLLATSGPVCLEVLVKKGNRSNLGRPTTTPVQNKLDLQNHIRGSSHL